MIDWLRRVEKSHDSPNYAWTKKDVKDMPGYTSLVVDTIYLIHMSLLFISHCHFLAFVLLISCTEVGE